MRKQKFLGRKPLILTSLALLLISGWEISVRLDAMYGPLKMFFSMAFGENIPFSIAMSYFDISLFEAPLWLLGCILVGLISLFLARRPGASFAILPLSAVLAVYGLTRESTFLTDFWQLIQPALLLALALLSFVNLAALPFRRRERMAAAPNRLPSDSPRITDAPRLRSLSHREEENSSHTRRSA